MSDKLHPSVREFKTFLQKHPKLVEDVRKSGKGWQEYYEKWALLGEDDPYWDTFKEAENSDTTKDDKENKKGNKVELMEQLTKLSENIDLNKLQKQIQHVNGTISTIQELIGQFQTKNTPTGPSQSPNQTFNMFKD